jgi:ribulose-5-phosphate 4-epimerase/fuculose-1-phosphate aldolase
MNTSQPAELKRFAKEIASLQQVGQLFSQRGWTRAGCCSYSLVVQSDPCKILITTGSTCRSKLSEADFLLVDISPGEKAVSSLPTRDIALHRWLVKHQQAAAIVQTQSVWCNLLGERFLSLDGVLFESHELLRRLSVRGNVAQAVWLPIAVYQHEAVEQLATIEKALGDTPTEFCSTQPIALIIQRDSLLTWAPSLEQAVLQAEALEYCCELMVRRAQLG